MRFASTGAVERAVCAKKRRQCDGLTTPQNVELRHPTSPGEVMVLESKSLIF